MRIHNSPCPILIKIYDTYIYIQLSLEEESNSQRLVLSEDYRQQMDVTVEGPVPAFVARIVSGLMKDREIGVGEYQIMTISEGTLARVDLQTYTHFKNFPKTITMIKRNKPYAV